MLICVINLLGTDCCLTLGMLTGTMTIWAESALREAKVVVWLLHHVFGLFISVLLRLFPENPKYYSTQRQTNCLFPWFKALTNITSPSYWLPLLCCSKSMKLILLSVIFLRFFSPYGSFYLHIISYIVHSFDTSMSRRDTELVTTINIRVDVVFVSQWPYAFGRLGRSFTTEQKPKDLKIYSQHFYFDCSAFGMTESWKVEGTSSTI